MKLYAPASSSFFLSTHLKVLLSIISLLSWIVFMQSLSDLLMMGIVIACGLIITSLNNYYNILEKRDGLPFLLLWWISGALVSLHAFQCESLAVLTYSLALFFLAECYSTENAPVAAFNMCSALAIGIIIFPPLMFSLPIVLFSIMKISPITLQKLTASLIGLLVPFWFMLAYTLLVDDLTFFVNFANEIRQIHFFAYSSVPMELVISHVTITLWLGLFIISHIRFVHSFQLRTRLVFICLAFFFLYIVALAVIFPQYLPIFLPMEIFTGILFVAYFVTHGSVISPKLTMMMSTYAFIIILAVNVWKNLSILGAILD